MKTNVMELAKKEAKVKIADLPRKYIKAISKGIAKLLINKWGEGYYIQLTKHIYAELADIRMDSFISLWRNILGTDAEAKTKEEYKEKKRKGYLVYLYMRNNFKYKIYVYDPSEGEYIFSYKVTKREALEWLARQIHECIEMGGIMHSWSVNLFTCKGVL